MKRKRIYIKSASQISMQNPLSEEWMISPIVHQNGLIRSVEPDFRDYLTPMEARRMGKLLKRALVTSLHAINQAGMEHPDAIITGTGLGCIDDTEQFLNAMCKEGEQYLKPTPFMQSTHNTISSLIGVYTKNHGYNNTYSHNGISFESALLDAWLQFGLNRIDSALVGAHDEVTPLWYSLLKKQGYVTENDLAGECSVSFILDTNSSGSLCELSGIKILHAPTPNELETNVAAMLSDALTDVSDISAVMTSKCDNPQKDSLITKVSGSLCPEKPLLHYKHLFGESYTSAGLGMYAAACCLNHSIIPTILYETSGMQQVSSPRNILLLNISEGKDYSLILLKSSCGI